MRIIKHKTNIDFIGKRRPALFISSVLNLSIIVGIAIFGFNYGVDFAGGYKLQAQYAKPATTSQVLDAVHSAGIQGDDALVQPLSVSRSNPQRGILPCDAMR